MNYSLSSKKKVIKKYFLNKKVIKNYFSTITIYIIISWFKFEHDLILVLVLKQSSRVFAFVILPCTFYVFSYWNIWLPVKHVLSSFPI